MKTLFKTIFALVAVLLLAPSFVGSAVADSGIIIKPNGAKKFAVMPAGANFPEGLAINSTNGEVVVGTFDVIGGNNKLVRFSSSGNVVEEKILGIGLPVLGLTYKDGYIYICNVALGEISRIPADFDDSTSIETVAVVPDIDGDSGTDPNPQPNDLTFDGNDLYFSDSAQGAVFKITDAVNCTTPCDVDLISQDPLLSTTGFPPFGANGVAFNANESVLFVTNTGNDTVLTVDPDNGDVAVLAQSINGADGVIYDADNDLLWVAANQADQVVAINPANGRVVAEIGEFLGVKDDNSARGLLFPASLAQTDNGKIIVTNLAIAVNAIFFGNPGEEPEEDITKYTVSFINIPEFD